MLQPNEGIYLDYAATTPVSKRVMARMRPYFSDVFGNASSLHLYGQKAQGVLDETRHNVADILGCSWKEIIFTPSATISINLALRGIVKNYIVSAKGAMSAHIVTTNIEHSAVLSTCSDLEREGIEVTYLPVNKEGLITLKQVENAIKENTVLVSVGYVNSEIGTVQPIKEIARFINFHNLTFKTHNLVFHSDAVQAVNYLDINVKNLGVDLMTLSAHKIYGPKGAALLYKKEGVELMPTITGGEQERGYMAGTENIPAILGFGEAMKETEELKETETRRLEKLQEYLILNIKNIKGVGINGFIPRLSSGQVNLSQNRAEIKRVPNNVNIYFENKLAEVLVPLFDREEIFVSGGSACTSRTPEPSYVIIAIGREKYAKNNIRITMGRSTTKKSIDKLIGAIKKLAK